MLASRSLKERFEAKVAAGPGCMLWMGSRNKGYGRIGITHPRKIAEAHRIAYELYVGPIPAGTEIDHLCRTPACVNVQHLEAVSHRVNVQRGVGAERRALQQRSKTHCPSGHAYNKLNTRLRQGRRKPDTTFWRECRECARIRDRKPTKETP